MKIFLTLLFLASSLCTHAQTSSENVRKVPVVVYTPFDFIEVVEASFSPTADRKQVLYPDSIVPERNVLYLDSDSVKSVTKNRAYFRETVLQNDSVFFLTLLPGQANHCDILGFYEKGAVRFTDADGNRYDNLAALIEAEFGSMDAFITRYLSRYEQNLVFDDRSNGLFVFDNPEEAAAQVKNDYNFVFYYHPDAQDRAIALLMDQIAAIKPDMTPAQRSDLADGIKAYIHSAQPIEFRDTLFRCYRGWNGFDYIPLAGYDLSSVLKDYFDRWDYRNVSRGLAIRRMKTLAAWSFLRQHYKMDIMASGASILDDTSVLNYLKDRLE